MTQQYMQPRHIPNCLFSGEVAVHVVHFIITGSTEKLISHHNEGRQSNIMACNSPYQVFYPCMYMYLNF